MKKKLILLTSFFLSTSLLISSVSNAAYFIGGRESGWFSAYYTNSVATYGYTNHYDTARTSWANITTKVNVGKVSSDTGTPDKYYIGTTSSTNLLGQNVFYKKSGSTFVVANTYETWAYATVSMYHNTMRDIWDMTQSQIISNATHEVGHSISLAHPPDSDNRSRVMRQGIQSIGPQAADKESLIYRWEQYPLTLNPASPNHNEEDSIDVVDIHSNFVSFDDVESLEASSDLIVIGKATKNFDEREHFETLYDDGNLQDFYTLTEIEIEKVLKAPEDFSLTQNNLTIVEPVSYININNKNTKITREHYKELLAEDTSVIFLKKNTFGQFSINNQNNGKFSLNKLTPINFAGEEYKEHENLRNAVFARFNLADK